MYVWHGPFPSADDAVLEQGEFGIVYQGVAHQLPSVTRGPVRVALKTFRNASDRVDKLQFAVELRILLDAGQHFNIVNLLGAARTGIN